LYFADAGQDLLTNMNSYPFLNNKHKPVFTSTLADIVPRFRRERVIDISNSPLVPASALRHKLEILHRAGEVDGGLPIIRDDVLVGLISAPDLEFGLDHLEDEADSLCLMAKVPTIDDSDNEAFIDPTDFSIWVNPVSMILSDMMMHNLIKQIGTSGSRNSIPNGFGI
jgi:chloride channel 3/4/5